MQSDEALYERLLDGDIRAFDLLYQRYERALFGFVCAHLRDHHEAEDALHETFMAVVRERDAGREIRTFRTWIYQVARNLCLNRARARERAARAVERAAVVRELDSAESDAQHQLEDHQQAEALREAVGRLPRALAEIYQLRAAGLSNHELAQVLAIPVGTVKSRIHEMVRRLREEMRR